MVKILVAFVNCDSRDERKLNGELFLLVSLYSFIIEAARCFQSVFGSASPSSSWGFLGFGGLILGSAK